MSAGPTDEEMAAIVAAVELAWPKPPPEGPRVSAGADDAAATASRWRFSGRWWARPMPGRGGGGKRWRSN